MPFPRGAKPSPRHALLAATPFQPGFGAPPAYAIVAPKLSMWFNDTYGICVTAQEAFSKAAWSLACGLPELFIPDSEVLRWANKYGFRDGANLAEVMDQMQKDGFTVNGVNYKDGPYNGVDYTNTAVLQAAIFTGPVNIAIDADSLPSDAGNKNGWWITNTARTANTNHCVALCGYGPASFLFAALGLPVPSGLNASMVGYLLFTWNTIGFVTQNWINATCAEAWVRVPTTPGQSPQPVPPPVPPSPPTPTPGPIVVHGTVTTQPHTIPAYTFTVPNGVFRGTTVTIPAHTIPGQTIPFTASSDG